MTKADLDLRAVGELLDLDNLPSPYYVVTHGIQTARPFAFMGQAMRYVDLLKPSLPSSALICIHQYEPSDSTPAVRMYRNGLTHLGMLAIQQEEDSERRNKK